MKAATINGRAVSAMAYAHLSMNLTYAQHTWDGVVSGDYEFLRALFDSDKEATYDGPIMIDGFERRCRGQIIITDVGESAAFEGNGAPEVYG